MKLAELKTELLPHQKRVVEKMEKQPGLLAVHGLGSGKSLMSIAVQDKLNTPATVVAPAALKGNYVKERNKHLVNPEDNPINIESLENVARKGEIQNKNPLLIVDEAHRLREPGSKGTKAVKKNEAKKRLLMTASPFFNHPADIAPLVNIAAGSQLIPENRKDFEKKYVQEKVINPGIIDRLSGVKPGTIQTVNPKTRGELQQTLNNWTDYHPSSTENFPSVTREEVRVPMTEDQLRVYDTLLEKAPGWVSAKVRANLPPDKQESKDLNAYLSAARQVSNTTAPFISEGQAQSPKIDEAVRRLKEHLQQNPQGKALVYSNFLEAGINPYKSRLDSEKIPYGEFTGELKPKDREALLKQYNENKLKALLLSSAGSEGLDTKATSLIQLLDPHWNNEKLKQVEGRGIRYKSHEELPEKDRRVHVQQFLATRPRSSMLERMGLTDPGGSTDEYLYNRAKEKEELHEAFKKLLSERTKQANMWNDLADAHFNAKPEHRDWSKFIDNISNRRFQRAIINHTLAEDKVKKFVTVMGKHFSSKQKGTAVQGSTPDKTYYVKQHKHFGGPEYTCSCPNYMYVCSVEDKECKHIRQIKDKKPKEVVKTAEVSLARDVVEDKTDKQYKLKNGHPIYHNYQTTRSNCSAASLRIVLSAYGDLKSEAELAKLIGVREGRGAECDDITRAARKLGYKAIDRSLHLDELDALLDSSIPVILDVQSFTRPPPVEHFVVVFEHKNDQWFILDPNYEKRIRALSTKELVSIWKGKNMNTGISMDQWGIVVLPKNL